MGTGKALIAVAAWGSSFVATRFALDSFSPAGLVASRLVMGTLLLLVVLKLAGRPVLPLRRDLPVCTALGLILGGHLLIQAHGLRYTTAINTAWIIAVIPVCIALGARIFLGHRMRAVGWAGVSLATFGVFLVTLAAPPDLSRARLGDMLQLVSCLTWTAYTLAATGPVRRNGALRVTGFAMAVAALPLAAAASASGWLVAPPTTGVLGAVAFLGLVCSGGALWLWFGALDEVGPTRAGATLYAEPFVTVAVAASLLGEPVTLHTITGGAAVLLGVWVVGRAAAPPPTETPL